MNSLWTITYSNYDLTVDRRALTYRLTETKTNTVWGDGLSLGWMEVKDRATDEITRHVFGDMKLFSFSEKAGPQGKRILFGLDCQGIPVDIYLIGSEREIQMVVESNRDSKTHTVEGFGLLPDLCSVPDGGSYLVIPNQSGAIVKPEDAPPDPVNLPVWSSYKGVSMPFVGAVHPTPSGTSLLTLITDSAYGSFTLQRQADSATLNTQYIRDPERRRLDLRVLPQSGGDYVTIARNYREKIISDRNHVTLRQKIQEHSNLASLTGSILFGLFSWDTCDSITALGSQLKEIHPPGQANFLFGRDLETNCTGEDLETVKRGIRERGYNEAHISESFLDFERSSGNSNLWEYMDARLQNSGLNRGNLVQGGISFEEWEVVNSGFFISSPPYNSFIDVLYPRNIPCQWVPLNSVVYHDCLVWYQRIDIAPHTELEAQYRAFLYALLILNAPFFPLATNDRNDSDSFKFRQMQRIIAILSPLTGLTFSAFLTAHRFLTSDSLVEEAIYSDKTRIVINQSDTETYTEADLVLPPLGFYVRHRQMEAFDALRIGEQVYRLRAWRIARSRDGKPLELSADILRQEFPVPER